MSHFTIPDPIEGDPDTLSEFAKKYQRISDALNSAARELGNLANVDFIVSDAVDKVRTKAHGAKEGTFQVALHFGGAASTYSRYASKLRDARARAEHARATIGSFKASADRAKQARDAAVDQAMLSLPNQQTSDELAKANQEFSHFQEQYEIAMGVYNRAASDKADAVRAAISELEDAAKASGLTDNFFEAVAAKENDFYVWAQKYLAPVLKALRSILKVISSILDIVAIVVFIFNPAAGLAIKALSILVSAAILLCSFVLLKLGRGSEANLLNDTIGLGVSAVSLLIPGLGLGGDVAKSAARIGVKEVATHLAKETAKHVILNLNETAIKYSSEGSLTGAGPMTDVTSGPWSTMPMAGPSPDGIGGDLIMDGVKSIPGVGFFVNINDAVHDVPAAFSGTGS